jgi:PiT family inorganic phosphate transporter
MGAGLGRAGGRVHWNVVGRMVVAWVLTLPAAALVGAAAEEVVSVFSNPSVGVTAVAAVAAAFLGFALVMARRHGNVDSKNVLDDEPAPVMPMPRPAPAV